MGRILVKGGKLHRVCLAQVGVVKADDGDILRHPAAGLGEQLVQVDGGAVVEAEKGGCLFGKLQNSGIVRRKDGFLFVMAEPQNRFKGDGCAAVVEGFRKTGVAHTPGIFFAVHNGYKGSVPFPDKIFRSQLSAHIIIGDHAGNIEKGNPVAHENAGNPVCLYIAVQKLIRIDVGAVGRKQKDAGVVILKCFLQKGGLRLGIVIGQLYGQRVAGILEGLLDAVDAFQKIKMFRPGSNQKNLSGIADIGHGGG